MSEADKEKSQVKAGVRSGATQDSKGGIKVWLHELRPTIEVRRVFRIALTFVMGVQRVSTERPNQILSKAYATNQGQSCSPAPCLSYLNPNAVATPAIGTYGNMGVSDLRAPGFWEWDQAITREFPLREMMRLEFWAEAFNVTNSVRFGAPNTTVSGTYGQITGDQPSTGAGTGISGGSGARIFQFAMKLVF